MKIPGISFVTERPPAPRDPHRMDIAMMVGFLAQKDSEEARAARNVVARRLVKSGWQDRIAEDATDLLDLPVLVRSLDEVEAIFDLGNRIDRACVILSNPLPDVISISSDSEIAALSLDGEVQQVTLPIGEHSLDDLAQILSDAFADVSVEVEPVSALRNVLRFTREGSGPGALMVFANPALGFAFAKKAETTGFYSPMGVALEQFFNAGGQEAYIVSKGDPVPIFADEAQKISALSVLLDGFGQGVDGFAALAAAQDGPAALPPAYPARVDWRGLAHLHGLGDVSFVLLPDLTDLLVVREKAEASQESLPRPKEIFQVCADGPEEVLDGQSLFSTPIEMGPDGFAIWQRIVGWAGREIANITPETFLVTSLPVLAIDNPLRQKELLREMFAGGEFDNAQLQLVTPWINVINQAGTVGKFVPPEGHFTGILAKSALENAAWKTVAGREQPAILRLSESISDFNEEIFEKISIIGYGQNGPEILSDRTPQLNAYNQANIRRLMALVMRSARHRGQAAVFESNGPVFWRVISASIISLLRQLHSAGALRGVKEQDAFSVAVGRDTMGQQDIDEGRAIVEVTLAPAHSLEQIEIAFGPDLTAVVERRGAA